MKEFGIRQPGSDINSRLSEFATNRFSNIIMETTYSKSMQSQLDFWEHFALTEKLQSLQESLSTIAKSQETFTQSRKELATKTKNLRNVSASERQTSINNLLKAYQAEIDRLTVRAV